MTFLGPGLSRAFLGTSTLFGFPRAREKDAVWLAPACRLHSGLSKGEGIRWRLSTGHLLISMEHLISSCCFVKSSDKKRNPFLFIFS